MSLSKCFALSRVPTIHAQSKCICLAGISSSFYRGIIAVVFCGITTKAFGETLYNDTHLSHHFWHITEYLLNTLLFTLGGTVWGNIISKSGTVTWEALDWAYLFALYGLVTAIRFFLVFAFYPITSRIGVGESERFLFYV